MYTSGLTNLETHEDKVCSYPGQKMEKEMQSWTQKTACSNKVEELVSISSEYSRIVEIQQKWHNKSDVLNYMPSVIAIHASDEYIHA